MFSLIKNLTLEDSPYLTVSPIGTNIEIINSNKAILTITFEDLIPDYNVDGGKFEMKVEINSNTVIERKGGRNKIEQLKDADLNITQHAETQVTFGHFPQAVLNAYADTGDPLDKAGAYGMQGLGSFLVVSIQGSASNVIGLPISLFIQTMLQHHLVRLKV